MNLTHEQRKRNANIIKLLVESKLKNKDDVVVERYRKNVELPPDGRPDPINKQTLWYAQMMCLLTSQQRSSYSDPAFSYARGVARFAGAPQVPPTSRLASARHRVGVEQ